MPETEHGPVGSINDLRRREKRLTAREHAVSLVGSARPEASPYRFRAKQGAGRANRSGEPGFGGVPAFPRAARRKWSGTIPVGAKGPSACRSQGTRAHIRFRGPAHADALMGDESASLSALPVFRIAVQVHDGQDHDPVWPYREQDAERKRLRETPADFPINRWIESWVHSDPVDGILG